MYSAASVYSYSSFSSSPPSSPGTYIDSSPPNSSPGPDGSEIYHEDDIPSMSLARDPFSAARDNWRPPQYEKKRPKPPITPPSTVKKPRYNKSSTWNQASPTNSTFRTSTALPVRTREQDEADVWSKASEQMVDEGNGRVSLEDQNLTYIPESFIEVLSNFYTSSERSESDYVSPMSPTHATLHVVTRPLNRASTEPAGAEIWGRPMFRTQSVATLSVLPLSLFSSCNLEHLTVLSLRKNNLSHLPPEVVNLKGLEELSIGQNRIQYLPAEILQMSLKALYLFPNPFLEPPSFTDPQCLGSSTLSRRKLTSINSKRQVSATRHLEQVPSLTELILRRLLLPTDPTNLGSETVLEEYYDLPLPEDPAPSLASSHKIYFPRALPPLFKKTLDACLPGSVYLDGLDVPSRYSAESTGSGSCPSPQHQRLGTPRLFVQHAEERYTWEKVAAGVEIGGTVAVRWRGCHNVRELQMQFPFDQETSFYALQDV
ncbi:hypothetical protein C0991_002036 [Blastosporella zonata]|nr:hypothetical protein C0991_002036 [Blastosporella zonata]